MDWRRDTRGLVTSGTAQGGLGTVPTNESRLLALCVRISPVDRFSEKTRPSSASIGGDATPL